MKGKKWCLCQTDWSDKQFMIRCDKCREWYHGSCLPTQIKEEEADEIKVFVCFKCEPKHGPSIKESERKSEREKIKFNYEGLINEYRFNEILEKRAFVSDKFERIKGKDLTLDYLHRTGLTEPVIIPDPAGLGMKMPFGISVRDVATYCGLDETVQVLQVSTQEETQMKLWEWVKYFELDPSKRTRLLNVISLEISDSELGKFIKTPLFVRKIDWIDNVWPKSLKPKQYPQVQLYCLMSVKDCFTDFHVDFGGTSVFYHLLQGQKVFYFIKPTEENLLKYTEWSNSSDQSNVFFADLVDECIKVVIEAGNTMIIPSGWIHAVYTPVDSLVIGGNFLHGFAIEKQLRVYKVEQDTKVPTKFTFPFWLKMQWFAIDYYTTRLQSEYQLASEQLHPVELDGIEKLITFLEPLGNTGQKKKLELLARLVHSSRNPKSRTKRRRSQTIEIEE